MGNVLSRQTSFPVLYEIDLGKHRLVLKSDRGIEVMCIEQTETILSLESNEAYRLMLSLHEMFKRETNQ
jgi:hypothetical protein